MDPLSLESTPMDEILIALGELVQSARHYACAEAEERVPEPNGQAGPPVEVQKPEQESWRDCQQ